jgi:CheY-like chemotaxis protein
VLYVEDSRVVALATTRMLQRCGFEVTHVISAEAALEALEGALARGVIPGFELVLTDVNLKGELTGGDLLERIREDFAYTKGELPVLVMTGDDNPANQSALLRAGANDLVHKPIEERLLITKLQFQLRVSRGLRGRAGGAGA